MTNIRSSAGPGRIAAGGTETRTTSGSGKSGPAPPAFCRKRGWGKIRKRVPVSASLLSSWSDIYGLLLFGLDGRHRRSQRLRPRIPLVRDTDLAGRRVVRAAFGDPLTDESHTGTGNCWAEQGHPETRVLQHLHERRSFRIGIDGAVRVQIHRGLS